MRKLIKQFVQICGECLPIPEPIYEFGSLQVPGQEGFADLRPFFPNAEYVGCDMRMGPGVDKILNLHDIDLKDGSVGTVLILDTLEHVEFPRKAMDEIYRILKPNGLVIVSSVMKFPIHDYPYDYWRFTPEGFRSLLRCFPNSFVDFVGDEQFPHTIIGIGSKWDISHKEISSFRESWEQCKSQYSQFSYIMLLKAYHIRAYFGKVYKIVKR